MRIKTSKDFKLIESFLASQFSAPTHWPDWNILISRYYNTNFYYYLAYEDEQLIGICPVHEVQDGLKSVLHTGQFRSIPYGGWIFTKEINIGSKFPGLKFYSSILGFSLPGLPQFPDGSRAESSRFLTLCIDLTQEIEWIWQNSVDSKRRNMIRKAEKNELTAETITKDTFEEFYQFYSNANQRYGLDSLEFNCLSQLLFDSANIGFHALIVRHDETIISALVLSYDKDYSMYWLGMNAASSPNLGQGEFLQWEAIKFAKAAGCKVYDLCYVEKERLPAIYEFKKGFSHSEFPIQLLSTKSLGYKILNKVQKTIKGKAVK